MMALFLNRPLRSYLPWPLYNTEYWSASSFLVLRLANGLYFQSVKIKMRHHLLIGIEDPKWLMLRFREESLSQIERQPHSVRGLGQPLDYQWGMAPNAYSSYFFRWYTMVQRKWVVELTQNLSFWSFLVVVEYH